VADNVDFRVRGGPHEALGFAQQALVADGFRVTAQADWTCRVEKGSGAKRALAGGLAERSILNLSVFDGGPGVTVVRVEKHASGWSGGAIGAHRAKKAFLTATEHLGSALQVAGHMA